MKAFVSALLIIALLPLLTAAVPSPPTAPGTNTTFPASAATRSGAAQIAALDVSDDVPVLAVATRHAAQTSSDAARRLRALGLEVQPLRRLPLALVRGTKRQLLTAAETGAARDVYPNERMQLHGRESRNAVRANGAGALGYTGQGVGVAIVDTGIDATHPDLRKRVTHNRKYIGPQYLVSSDVAAPHLPLLGELVIPIDRLPYNNSDLGSGHGTHVAGIVAADGSGNQELLGVAPGANLIGYSAGDVAAVHLFAILAAFDDILVHRDAWGIRIVNNSWGSFFRFLDPAHPIHAATKALHDAGLVVVFSADNYGEEMTINPWSIAPWVISVGSTSLTGQRSSFTSAGLRYDNSSAVPLPQDGHLRFEGDRIGLYHPDVSAPGTAILSTGTPSGLLTLALPGGGATLSGTSQAAPHVAGVAALLLSANPRLTPDQVRRVMQVTARPVAGGSAFWQSGYGLVDAEAATRLVRRNDFSEELLAQLQAAADHQVRAQRQLRVLAVDQWAFDPLPATVRGLDTRTFPLDVLPGTKAIRGSVAYPGAFDPTRSNPFNWQLTLIDPAGRRVARSTPSDRVGVSSFSIADNLPPGRWTVEVAGVAALSAPGFPQVSLSIAQLAPHS
ncbi:MAG: S8 family serine peptidase [Nitriliruptorales bacterium]